MCVDPYGLINTNVLTYKMLNLIQQMLSDSSTDITILKKTYRSYKKMAMARCV